MITKARCSTFRGSNRTATPRPFSLVASPEAPRPQPESLSVDRRGVQPATRESYRDAMRQLVAGVCVVTFGAGEEKTGVIATSVVAVSAEPPSLLFCIQRGATSYSAVASSDAFAVNVLTADQRETADRFAGSRDLRNGDPAFSEAWRELPSGVPGLATAAAILDCEVEERLERSTHAIIVGRVRHVLVGDACGALLYWRAAYDQIGWRKDEIARATGLSPRGTN
jgi:flavin reductase (DIM6/NTAB) family NADH-FMN oxidoreductase RutF